MPRKVIQLYEETSAIGGGLDTNDLTVEEFDFISVHVWVELAAAGQIIGYILTERGNYRAWFAATPAGGSNTAFSIGRDAPAVGGVLDVPRRIRITVAGAVGARVNLLVYGTRYDP